MLVSDNPLGPFVYLTNLNPKTSKNHLRAQSSDVFQVMLRGGKTAYIWSADQWLGSASGFKGNDTQYWEPLVFKTEFVKSLGKEIAVPHRFGGGRFVNCFNLDLPGISNDGKMESDCLVFDGDNSIGDESVGRGMDL